MVRKENVMFIMPMIISIVLYAIAKKFGYDDDILITGIVVCWVTAISLFAYDMIGEYVLGLWTTTMLI